MSPFELHGNSLVVRHQEQASMDSRQRIGTSTASDDALDASDSTRNCPDERIPASSPRRAAQQRVVPLTTWSSLCSVATLIMVCLSVPARAFQTAQTSSSSLLSKTTVPPVAPWGYSQSQSMSRQQLPFLSVVSNAANGCLSSRFSTRTTTALSMAPASDGDDETEWSAVLSAFRMYKAAYGDLKVPGRFIVPLAAPWPEPAWGNKLGRTVAAIRQTGKFVANDPGRREILEELGFVWAVRKPRTDSEAAAAGASSTVTVAQVWESVKAYKELVQPAGPLAIPSSFVVPNVAPWPETVRGLPLGQQLAALQTTLEQDITLQERFAALGYYVVDPNASSASSFDSASSGSGGTRKVSASEARFQKVFSALATYKKIYNDLLVPQPFVVPEDSDQWPDETWGLRLGARVNAIRSQGTFVNNNPDRRAMLDDLGFAWSPPKSERGRPGRKKTDEAFLPDFDDKPAAGGAPADMESPFGASFDFDKDFLPQDGDSKAPVWGLEGGRELQEAATAAQDAMPAVDEYQPPRTLADSMEEATQRALDCGVIEGTTAKKRVIKGKREKDIPWFNDDFGDDFVFEDVVEALTVYKQIYGDFSNFTAGEAEFTVPGPDSSLGFDDDELFDGFDVDASARAAAAISQYEEQGQTDRSEELIATEIQRLKEDAGSSLVEREVTAVVKETKAGEWPEHLAGMSLGSLVSRIKDGSLEVKHLPARKKQLDAIKFNWGDKMRFMDVPFEKAMCAMYAYYLVRGDMFVYEDFVMPSEDPWPDALAGYELGKAVKRIRELQNFLEAYHPEKVSLLRMIDFVWFPTTAMPLDPNEQEMTSETLLLSAMGHPDYAKMIDIPMGLPDKIISDGPIIDSDDPKMWWRKWHNWEYVKDYWYQQGRRDNAFVLRGMGYPQMADEHEAKYGPGLFQQINATMVELEAGFEHQSQDEKRELVEKLDFFRQEMLGCTDLHPQARDQFLEDLDLKMIAIMKEGGLDMAAEDEMESGDYEYESVDEDVEEEAVYADAVVDEVVDEVVYEEVEVEEFDVEDELGLDAQ